METGLNGDIYACVSGGDIYVQTGGVGDFVGLGQTSRSYNGMTVSKTGDVYACVNGGDIYKQTGGTGDFVAMNQTIRNWHGMATGLNGDIYACSSTAGIYALKDGAVNNKLVFRANVDFVGAIDFVNVYEGIKPCYYDDSEYWLPTLANVAAGPISNTQFYKVAGTFSIAPDTNKEKWLTYLAAGYTTMTQRRVYGTWVFRFRSPLTSNTEMYFISDAWGRVAANQLNGYRFFVQSDGVCYLQKCKLGVGVVGIAGAIISAAGAIAANTNYTFAITRTSAGVFTVYYKKDGEAWAGIPGSAGGTVGMTDNEWTSSLVWTDAAGAAGLLMGTRAVFDDVLTINDLEAKF